MIEDFQAIQVQFDSTRVGIEQVGKIVGQLIERDCSTYGQSAERCAGSLCNRRQWFSAVVPQVFVNGLNFESFGVSIIIVASFGFTIRENGRSECFIYRL